MSSLEQKIIEKIRANENPDKLMEYMEELLFNPQKFQEALKTLSARP